jgi:hypothetical protein
MQPLITPIPNLNGNSADSLVQQCRQILAATRALRDAIRNASDLVHGRNFQTLPAGVATVARAAAEDAWRERQAWLSRFEAEVTEMALTIERGGL